MLGNRYAQHSFATIPNVHIQRSSFDRSFGRKGTMDFDYLNPILVDEVLPGDTFNLSLSVFARLQTQLVPIMDNMYIDFFFFFVPNRLVMDNWEKLMGAQTDPGDTIDYLLPTMPFPAGGPEVGTIFDMMGLPTDVTGAWTLNNTLPFRGYNLIWNDWFRDQNLQESIEVPTDDGPDAPEDFTLKKRNKRHDYITSGLPDAQKWDPVTIPLGTSAPVITNSLQPKFSAIDGTFSNLGMQAYNSSGNLHVVGGTAGAGKNVKYGNETGLQTDLSEAIAPTINELREAFMMQSLFELDARGGTRYIEVLSAHFGVVSPDFRLQRPELLSVGQIRIDPKSVPQTSASESGKPQGNLAAYATASGTGLGFTKSFVEHGYVIGLACARADITYQQGLERFWNRQTRYDHFWPKLQQMGEQAVLKKEVMLIGNATDNDTLCYQERYGEYRYKPSQITGVFRSTYATSLDKWHLAEEFETQPSFNDTFIQQNTPITRALAVTNEPHILYDMFFKYICARPLMTNAVPASLGRF